MFNTIFDSVASGMKISTVVICMGVAAVLGLLIAGAHKMTGRATRDFLMTLATLPILVTVVMMMINGSLGTSIAVLGAFSLVRFRSIPGSGREIASVFFSMAVGLALGMGHVLFACVFTIFTCVMMIIFSKLSVFSTGREQVLKVVIPEDLDYTKVFDSELRKYTIKHRVVKTKTINMGSLYKVTYVVEMKDGVSEKEFLDALRVKNCNLQVLLSSDDNEKEEL